MIQDSMLLCHSLMGMQVYNYPVVNHGRMRGLLQRLRSRLLSLQGERAALQQQLTELPLDTADSQAPLRNKVHPLLMPYAYLPEACPRPPKHAYRHRLFLVFSFLSSLLLACPVHQSLLCHHLSCTNIGMACSLNSASMPKVAC